MGVHTFTGAGGNGGSGNNGNGTPAPPSGIVPSMPVPPNAGGAGRAPQQTLIDAPSYVRDMGAEAKGKPPVMFRDGVVSDVMSVLSQSMKRNALLIGPAGCGKTAVVEELARMMEEDDPRLAPQLRGLKVYELPLASMVAGTGIVGSLEEKLNEFVKWAEDPDARAVVFMDEAHLLASNDHSFQEMAQVLKPALARSKMRVIAATTTQEAKRLADDPAFSRRFSKVIVDELTREQTEELVRARIPVIEAHHKGGVAVDPGLARDIVRIADGSHAAGAHRPDTALTLLDRVCADVAVSRAVAIASCDDLDVVALLESQPATVSEPDLARSAEVIASGHSKGSAPTEADVLEALSPIRGQGPALRKVAEAVGQRSLGLFEESGPLVMLLAGSTGVGKTECARLLAECLCRKKPITLNMAEFHSSASINRIIGSPLGYIGSDTAKELPFDALETDPYQVILLDEFEKCDRSVQRLFMSAFDSGEMQTAAGKTVDFNHAVFVCTTNAGGSMGRRAPMGFGAGRQDDPGATFDRLSGDFDPELLNRFDLVVEFGRIDEAAYRQIVRDAWRRERDRLAADRPRLALPDDIEDAEVDAIVAANYVPEMGARNAGRAVRRLISEKAAASRRGVVTP